TDSHGNVLYQTNADQRSRLAIDPGVAYIMAQIMADDSNRAPIFGFNSALHWNNHTVAAKTGTTDNFKDAVTVAFNPVLAVGLWVGDILDNRHFMVSGSDGVFVASPGVHTFVNVALTGVPANLWYAKPPDVVPGPSNSWYLSGTTSISRLPGDSAPSPTPTPVNINPPEVLQQAMRDESIDPIDNPDVEVLELERGRPARLKATITVMPQVTLGDVSNLALPDTPAVEVTDQMLERRLDDVREPLAEVTPVEREVRTGDVAVIDVEVEANGQVVESESRKAMEAELKEGVLLPELLAALPGTFVDEQREVTLKFPDDYSEPKLAAREGTIRVTVRGIK